MANIDEKIEKAIKPIVKMYSELETELLIRIAENFKVNDEFINSDYWRIQKLNEMGAFNSEVIDFIAKYTNRSINEIKKALQSVFKDTLDLDTLRSAYKNNKIAINPTELLNSPVMMSIMNNSYSETSNRFIQMSKLIENATRQAYLNIVEKEYLATSTGIKSYGESIRESLNELANKGIDTLDYFYEKDGLRYVRHYSIESAVRREILTGARQLSGNLNVELIEETKCEYVKFSEHLDCRPTHFDWQGTIVETKNKKWKEISDYGSITGIYGINCRHYVEPYFGDNKGDEEKKLTKEECDEAYEISQNQRYLERGLRAWKRRKEMSKASGDTEMYNKSKNKVKEWSNRLDSFTKDNDRRRDYTREYVSKMDGALPRTPKKEKDDVLVINNELPYEDLTDNLSKIIEKNKNNTNYLLNRRLEYSMDKDKNIYYDCYFDPDKYIQEEIKYQGLIEKYTGYKTYLNPKTHTQNVKTPDYWIEDIDELWDLRNIDGESPNIIDNILNKKSKQTYNLVLKKGNTPYNIDYLKEKIKYAFDNNQRTKIKQVILLDDSDNVILYYKR